MQFCHRLSILQPLANDIFDAKTSNRAVKIEHNGSHKLMVAVERDFTSFGPL